MCSGVVREWMQLWPFSTDPKFIRGSDSTENIKKLSKTLTVRLLQIELTKLGEFLIWMALGKVNIWKGFFF